MSLRRVAFWFLRYDLNMRRDRKITRLRDYDYSQSGAYAVTICAHEKRCAFGKIETGLMRLNRFGVIASEQWLAIPHHRAHVQFDEFVIMPNHMHGILLIVDSVVAENELRQFGQAQDEALSSIIGSCKSAVTREINLTRQPTTVWQSRFYEHIIRHDQDLQHQRQYILSNPSKWADESFAWQH